VAVVRAVDEVVPGPDGLVMLRNLPRMLGDPLRFLEWCAAEYGDVTAFPLPGLPPLLLNDPADVRRVLVTNHRNWDKNTVQYRTLGLVTGEGLLVSDGDTWQRHRRLAQPAFHRGAVTSVAEHTVAAAAGLQRRWAALPAGATVDVADAMLTTTLEVVGASLFGADLADDAPRLVDAVLHALEVVVRRARSPLRLPASVPTPASLQLRRALRTLDNAVATVVGQHARRDADEHEPTDLLALLLGTGLSPREVRDEVVTMVIAGHETVASSLTWTWHLLAGAPQAEARLHAELDAVLGDRQPALDDLPALRWTRQVVDESLRLYPPAWVLTRRAVGPDVLGGREVPAGTLVLISPWVLHRRADLWPDPQAFRPERFDSGNDGAGARTAYVPFGAGPRLCIGREFALLEATLLLAALAARFRLTRPPGPPPGEDALVTIQPRGGLAMTLSPRSTG